MNLLRGAESVLITEASAMGVSKLAAKAAAGEPTILEKRNQPIAAVIGYSELERLSALESDVLDLALVLARSATDTGERMLLDSVIEQFGFTREQLEALPDPGERPEQLPSAASQ